jgi:hypothetical protein
MSTTSSSSSESDANKLSRQERQDRRDDDHGAGVEWGIHHEFKLGTARDEWIAKSILRKGADHLCPECLDDEVRHVLSEPHIHSPRVVTFEVGEGSDRVRHVELAVLPNARRHCEHCGLVTMGGIIADRPAEEFREVLDEVVESIDAVGKDVRQARSDALAAKGRGRKHDVTIMREFIREIL